MTKQPDDTFHLQSKTEIAAMGNDVRLHATTSQWIQQALNYNYTHHFTWLGVPIIQSPQDIVALQEIIFSVRPDLIIESGVAHGGSIIFYASLLELLGHGKVLGIDIDIRSHNRRAIESHPLFRRIRLIEGSSIDSAVVSEVHRFTHDKRCLLVLDSNHTHEHVLQELSAYAPLVTIGSYCVVMDGGIEDIPDVATTSNRPWGKGNNPKTAVHEYLRLHPGMFEIDKMIEHKLLITANSDGYLRRVR